MGAKLAHWPFNLTSLHDFPHINVKIVSGVCDMNLAESFFPVKN
jgi:hypothetical protein